MKELSLNALDIAQNSVTAGATLISIDTVEEPAADLLTISVTDNGKGMSREFAERVTDPFCTTRTTRKVGLGIPLFKMAAEMAGGHFSIESEPGRGTKVTATVCAVPMSTACRSAIWRGRYAALIQMNPGHRLCLPPGKGETKALRWTRGSSAAVLDGVPLDTPEVGAVDHGIYLQENLAQLYTSA